MGNSLTHTHPNFVVWVCSRSIDEKNPAFFLLRRLYNIVYSVKALLVFSLLFRYRLFQQAGLTLKSHFFRRASNGSSGKNHQVPLTFDKPGSFRFPLLALRPKKYVLAQIPLVSISGIHANTYTAQIKLGGI